MLRDWKRERDQVVWPLLEVKFFKLTYVCRGIYYTMSGGREDFIQLRLSGGPRHLVRWIPVRFERIQPGYYKAIGKERRFRSSLRKKYSRENLFR